MPIMQAFLTRTGDAPQQQALCEAYAHCLVDTLSSQMARVRIQLVPVERSGVFVAGQPAADLAMLHLYLLPGRPAATKAAVIAGLAKATADHTGLDDTRIRVLIHEVERDAIGFGAQTAAALGF